MTDDLRAILYSLKLGARVKEYADEPEGKASYGPYFMTYCLERTIARTQPTLAVSRLDRAPLAYLPFGFEAAISDVFGVPVIFTQTTYPKRGETRLYIW